MPFSYQSTSTSKKAADYGNKRVEVFVNAEVAPDVLSAIGRLNLEATLYDSKGLGKEKQMVRGGRGTIESQATYSTRRTIVTIVNSNQLDDTVKSIKNAVEGRGGVLAVSPVEEFLHL